MGWNHQPENVKHQLGFVEGACFTVFSPWESSPFFTTIWENMFAVSSIPIIRKQLYISYDKDPVLEWFIKILPSYIGIIDSKPWHQDPVLETTHIFHMESLRDPGQDQDHSSIGRQWPSKDASGRSNAFGEKWMAVFFRLWGVGTVGRNNRRGGWGEGFAVFRRCLGGGQSKVFFALRLWFWFGYVFYIFCLVWYTLQGTNISLW